MLELAAQIIEITGTDSKIVYKELPSDDPKQRKPDISKAISVLNWKPTIQINEGLELTLQDFERRVSKN
jgi:nucleoside-diphosphate-sugar epimerase